MKHFMLSAVALVLIGCNGHQVENLSVGSDVIQARLTNEQSQDFLKSLPPDGLECLSHVKAAICVSSRDLDHTQTGFDPDCSRDNIPAEFLSRLPDLIEALPPVQKDVFCHLDRLQIEPKLDSLAYAAQIYDPKDNVIGNMIGIRPDSLTGSSGFDLFSWKEQLSFGLSKPKDPTYQISPAGVRIDFGVSQFAYPTALNVVTHELSHLVDFMNHVLDYTTNRGRTRVNFKPGTYNALSWPNYMINKGTPAPQILKRYPWLAKMCYYNCKDKFVSPENTDKVYHELQSSSFMNVYSVSGVYEDFAEASVAFLLRDKGFRYRVIAPNNQVLFDANEAWNTPQRAAKKAFLEHFYSRKDLKTKIDHGEVKAPIGD